MTKIIISLSLSTIFLKNSIVMKLYVLKTNRNILFLLLPPLLSSRLHKKIK